MSPSYKLRFPFRPTSKISGLDEPQVLATEPIVACLSKSEPYFILTVDGFGSEDQARDFLATAWGSVMWASVKAGVGLQAETGLGQVVYADDPTQAGMNLAQSFGLAAQPPSTIWYHTWRKHFVRPELLHSLITRGSGLHWNFGQTAIVNSH